ncbi:3',5'-cyclic adenosine monophosphate phosphodiesterase CpdA [Nocardia cyriacigeorgica]|uniref:3',5'-cyclic adenosine monophosphate phosphodiesterase CpdA n=2 Tax=Nocardia cyriacigeorgica TaxID=135487 RepID=A0A4U8W565_9NOCA|nr:3',5'-cyclic adenosine monophosphate phosphodiesterase CpdA [Nocardia cyriacigeorgica]
MGMILVAQVSDTHFDLGPRNVERAERVMAYLADLRRRPDAILVTGDVTDSGKPDQYAEARIALQADIPVYALPGNHDDRGAFREVLLGVSPSTEPINHAHRVGPLTVVLLDSSIPGEPSGRLTDDTYDWLRTVLAEAPADDPILLAMHHPPAHLYSPVVDEIALADPGRLAELVAADDRILAVLTGHAHSAATTTFAGKPLLVAPSTASVLGGEWELALPDHVMDYAPDPAVALHVIDENHALTTHFRTVPMGGWIGVAPY